MHLPIVIAAALGTGNLTAAAPDNKASAPTPAVMQVCPKPAPYLSIDYLYWKAEEDGLVFAIYEPGGLPSGPETSLVNQHFSFDSGFRAGVGYDLPYEMYDIVLNWTRFHTDQSRHYSVDDHSLFGMLLVGFQGSSDLGVFLCDAAKAKWHLNLDMLDLELGRKYAIGKRLSMRPHIGLKGGWIEQGQKVEYIGLHESIPLPPTETGNVKRKNDYKGIGPRFGVDMRWGLGPQFGLFGNVSGALLYGHFDAKTVYFYESPTVLASNTLPNNSNRLCPTVQMLLGGDWSRCLYNKWWIRFGAAYEVQFWWNQWQAFSTVEGVITNPSNWGGDLALHGLTLQARFDF